MCESVWVCECVCVSSITAAQRDNHSSQHQLHTLSDALNPGSCLTSGYVILLHV